MDLDFSALDHALNGGGAEEGAEAASATAAPVSEKSEEESSDEGEGVGEGEDADISAEGSAQAVESGLGVAVASKGALSLRQKFLEAQKEKKKMQREKAAAEVAGYPQVIKKLRAQNEELRKQLAAASAKLGADSAVENCTQKPLAEVTYQFLQPKVRAFLDTLLQAGVTNVDPAAPTPPGYTSPTSQTKLAADNNNGADIKEDYVARTRRGCVQYFETFCLDRFGITNLPRNLYQPAEAELFNIPAHEKPVNDVPYPFLAAKRGKGELAVTTGVCFNCGSDSHSVRDCPVKRDDATIRHNSKLFRELGSSRKRDNNKVRFSGRYFTQESIKEEATRLLSQLTSPAASSASSGSASGEIVLLDEEAVEPSGVLVIDDSTAPAPSPAAAATAAPTAFMRISPRDAPLPKRHNPGPSPSSSYLSCPGNQPPQSQSIRRLGNPPAQPTATPRGFYAASMAADPRRLQAHHARPPEPSSHASPHGSSHPSHRYYPPDGTIHGGSQPSSSRPYAQSYPSASAFSSSHASRNQGGYSSHSHPRRTSFPSSSQSPQYHDRYSSPPYSDNLAHRPRNQHSMQVQTSQAYVPPPLNHQPPHQQQQQQQQHRHQQQPYYSQQQQQQQQQPAYLQQQQRQQQLYAQSNQNPGYAGRRGLF